MGTKFQYMKPWGHRLCTNSPKVKISGCSWWWDIVNKNEVFAIGLVIEGVPVG